MKGTESIVVDYHLNESPGQVWRLLTEPALLEQWLMPNDIAATVGHRFNFRSRPIGDWNGIVHCEVLESDPPHKFAYSWQGGSEADPTRLDTVVTWTLTPTSSGTLLNLVHSGFDPNDFAFQAMGNGWRNMLPPEKATRILESTSTPA
jgi:uncharacterized protein YndB with AHSA1/START domain